MRDRFGATDPRAMMIRFHTQTGGVTLTAQQPLNNVVRVALQAFAAVCGGTQSLHTNGYDEALALPTERAAKLALRTQQIIAHESGAADTVDPFAGSYYVEALTDEVERRARTLIERVDELGGSVQAISFIKGEIEESAFGYHERYRTGQDVVVGVNKYAEEDVEVEDILRVDPEAERAQLERLAAFKAGRDQALADRRLEELKAACRGDENLLPPIREALRDSLHARRGLRRDARGLRRLPAGVLKASAQRKGTSASGRSPSSMEAKRTLVKSPPELWAELSDMAALARHLGEFGEIRITRTEPESVVEWEGDLASGSVRLEPSGWGTKVTLTALPVMLDPPPPPEPEPEPEPDAAGPAAASGRDCSGAARRSRRRPSLRRRRRPTRSRCRRSRRRPARPCSRTRSTRSAPRTTVPSRADAAASASHRRAALV